jgi:hypothetical protein
LCIASNGPRIPLSFAGKYINRRNLHRATNDAYDAIGFLLGTFRSGHPRSLAGPDVLREDVSTRPPADPGLGSSARATVLVIGPATVVLSDLGSSPGKADPVSPVAPVSTFLMSEAQG